MPEQEPDWGCTCGSEDRWLMSPNHDKDCPMYFGRWEPDDA